MYYPCAKFCDFSFSRFGYIVRTDRTHTHTHTHTHRERERETHRITDAAKRFTPATVVGVSKDESRINVNLCCITNSVDLMTVVTGNTSIYRRRDRATVTTMARNDSKR